MKESNQEERPIPLWAKKRLEKLRSQGGISKEIADRMKQAHIETMKWLEENNCK